MRAVSSRRAGAQEALEHPELVEDLHRRGVDRVAAEIAEEVGVLFEHPDRHPARANSSPAIMPAGPPPTMIRSRSAIYGPKFMEVSGKLRPRASPTSAERVGKARQDGAWDAWRQHAGRSFLHWKRCHASGHGARDRCARHAFSDAMAGAMQMTPA
jgi:hypothetical protein